MTIPAHLERCLSTGSSRPFVTFYDHALGEQAELSVATTANWVNKTANLLHDGLGAQPGQTVRVHLPAHWVGVVWLLGVWTAGLVLANDGAAADVHVIGPDDLDDPDLTTADEVLAVSLTTLGTRFTEPLPAGIWDYHGEAPGFGDHYTPYVRDPDPAVRTSERTLTHEQLVTGAAGRGWPAGTRLLTGATADDELPLQVAGMLVVGGSLVVVRNPAPERLADLAATEHVTETAGSLGSST